MASIERHVLPKDFRGLYRCDSGCVHLVWNGRNLHFAPSEFLALAADVARFRDVVLSERIRVPAVDSALPLGVM